MTVQTNHDGIPGWIADWFASLEETPLASIIQNPEQTIVTASDMIIGFCEKGALASERVASITGNAQRLFIRAHDLGVSKFALLQDAHDPNAREFDAWPPHCVKGTEEAETIPELATLPFADTFEIILKNSLDPGFATSFDAWLDRQRPMQTAIIVGNCTDLCVYALAMHLRLCANAEQWSNFEVVVPANCVDTYDLSVDAAAKAGTFPHPGEFYHQVFLYHMALNGIRVVASTT